MKRRRTDTRAKPRKRVRYGTTRRASKKGVERYSTLYSGRFTGTGGVEKKYIDTTLGDLPFELASAPDIIYFNTIPQNTTASGRIGESCLIKSIQCRLVFERVTNRDLTADILVISGPIMVRCIIFIDQQTNGTGITAATDLLQFGAVTSPLNMTNSHRFIVLKDWMFSVNQNMLEAGTNSTIWGQSAVVKKWYKRINVPVEFNGVNGTIGECQSKGLFMLFFTDVDSTTYTSPIGTLNGVVRIRYTDS